MKQVVDVYFYDGNHERTTIEDYNAENLVRIFNNIESQMIAIGDIVTQRNGIQKIIPVRE